MSFRQRYQETRRYWKTSNAKKGIQTHILLKRKRKRDKETITYFFLHLSSFFAPFQNLAIKEKCVCNSTKLKKKYHSLAFIRKAGGVIFNKIIQGAFLVTKHFFLEYFVLYFASNSHYVNVRSSSEFSEKATKKTRSKTTPEKQWKNGFVTIATFFQLFLHSTSQFNTNSNKIRSINFNLLDMDENSNEIMHEKNSPP